MKTLGVSRLKTRNVNSCIADSQQLKSDVD